MKSSSPPGVSSTSVSRTRSALPFTLKTRSPPSVSIQKSSPIANSFSRIWYFVPPSSSRRPLKSGILASSVDRVESSAGRPIAGTSAVIYHREKRPAVAVAWSASLEAMIA